MARLSVKPQHVAFVSQPWNQFQPPVEAGSIAIWTDQVARLLKKKYDVTVYAKRAEQRHKVHFDDHLIRYRFLSLRQDLRLHRSLKKYRVDQRGCLPIFASRSAFLFYSLKVAFDLRQAKIDLVHIHNLSQFVPIIRLLNPNIKIVLHMHCEWLSQLDPYYMAKRIKQCDLLLGCSDYISSCIRTRFKDCAVPVKTIANGVDPAVFKPEESSAALVM